MSRMRPAPSAGSEGAVAAACSSRAESGGSGDMPAAPRRDRALCALALPAAACLCLWTFQDKEGS
eukprot:7116288-Prymnesium_polylepis.2